MRSQAKRYSSGQNRRRLPFYRQLWFWVVIIILIIAGIWFFFLRSNDNQNSTQSVNTSDNSNGKVPESTAAKGESEKSEDPNAEKGKEQTPKQYDGEDPNTLDELTGYISYNAVNYDHYSIRTTINQYLNSGTCSLVMTSNDNTVTKTADIINSASTSTCQGFDIALDELPSGHWNIEIKLSADGKTGTIAGEIDL